MFVVVYEFQVRPGGEAAFGEGWARVTDALRAHRGSRGSRLHAAADGKLVAYAQWPDQATFDASAAAGPVPDEPGYQLMRDNLAGPTRIVYKLEVLDDRLAGA